MKKEMTSGSYFQTLNIVYYSQMVMLVVFGVVVFYLKPDEASSDEGFDDLLQYLLFAFFIGGVTASYFIPRMVIGKITSAAELKTKLRKYLPAAIIRAACLEMPGLFACVVTFLTGNTLYLLTVPLLLILFLFYRPSKNLVSEELKLTADERSRLDIPGGIVADVEQRHH